MFPVSLLKTKMGHYPMVVPYGYMYYRKSKGKFSHIIIDPDKAPFVKRMYELIPAVYILIEVLQK